MARQRALEHSRAPPVEWVVGFDLSLTGAAACALPLDWVERMDWAEARIVLVGQKLKNDDPPEMKDDRLLMISHALYEFLVELVLPNGEIAGAFIEGYAYSQGAQRGHALGELGGVIKVMYRQAMKVSLQPVAASSARKLLCGRVPSKRSSGMRAKDFVGESLRRMGCPFEDDNVRDALVVANWGLSELGRPALIGESQ